MGNPAQVTASTTIATNWGNDVVSRVVGVYASLAAAEADGRTYDGAVIGLTDGSVWYRWTDWHRISSWATGGWQTPVDLTGTAAQSIVFFPSSLSVTSGSATMKPMSAAL